MIMKTKMRHNGGSMLTVVPKPIVDLLEYNSGDELEWEVDIKEKGAKISIKKVE